jgi:hypothetical protein
VIVEVSLAIAVVVGADQREVSDLTSGILVLSFVLLASFVAVLVRLLGEDDR